MRRIYIIMTTAMALILSACSSGDSSFENKDVISENNDNTFKTNFTTKISVKSCENYIIIKVNDILVKEDDITTIKIVHDANGSKKVCTLIGTAHLIRKGKK